MSIQESQPSEPVYVVDGARSPFIKAGDRPGPFHAGDLAAQTGAALLLRQPFNAEAIDEVILGNTMAGPDEANIGRVAALRMGCGEATPGYTVHRNCASGMQALDNAAASIADGRSDLILAGGVEAMSHAPVLLREDMLNWLADWRKADSPLEKIKLIPEFETQYVQPVIGLLRGLTDPIVGLNMGQTTEKEAQHFGVSRQAMDEYAALSQQRLAHADEAGYFKEERTPLYSPDGTFFGKDNGMRPDTTPESLARLKPAFDPFGSVTAGNSSQITDGACWLLLASERGLKKHGLTPIARLSHTAWAALDPSMMGLGVTLSSTAILKQRGWGLDDIDYWEINEAFAGQVLACLNAWADDAYCREQLGLEQAMGELDMTRLNVDGGAIGLGHPIGASGARIVLHLIHVLRRHQARRGIASLCIGGGQGGAMLVENIES
ncbi:acetyl-CoA C-acetyltransferase [Hahella sp. KA22]|uniref:acetyl-CoA C-acetyltransferase n=1 Tax=Hahella sp. KA22 TaxID=1628392 RepID=UPI000FDE0B13|nr:acetyl-CoA C-acetyltransferase [Hahella sp. KA22]AZZ92483.1 acetyl-CoA C-acetyltransferase [Hahella sp. KA22]QAY55857.1 acetyl-CoA C-acetyltransferase [Hahella sp. KA22]